MGLKESDKLNLYYTRNWEHHIVPVDCFGHKAVASCRFFKSGMGGWAFFCENPPAVEQVPCPGKGGQLSPHF